MPAEETPLEIKWTADRENILENTEQKCNIGKTLYKTIRATPNILISVALFTSAILKSEHITRCWHQANTTEE